MSLPKYILCGSLGKPFGYQGAFHLYPHSQDSEYLLGLKTFYLSLETGEFYPLTVLAIRAHQDHFVVTFQSSEEVIPATHHNLYVLESQLPVLTLGRFYWHQLEGLKVVNREGVILGHVSSLYSNGVQDVLLLDTQKHIPFVWQEIVHQVDLEKKLIVVDFNALEDEDR